MHDDSFSARDPANAASQPTAELGWRHWDKYRLQYRHLVPAFLPVILGEWPAAGLCEEGARPGRDRQASAVNTATLSLTHREREVAELVALGLTNRQIAAKLFISERTAEFHVEQIRNKLGFHTRSQIAAWMALDQPRPRPIDAAPFSALPDDSTKRQRLRPSLRLAVFGLAAATVLAASGLV